MKPVLVFLLVALLGITGCAGAAPSSNSPEVEAGTRSAGAVQADTRCFFEPGDGEPEALVLAAEPDGVLLAAVPRQPLVVEALSAEWVLVVAPDSGSQGWLRSEQGSLNGACENLEILPTLPPLPERPTVPPPTCTITAQAETAIYAQPGQAEPSGVLAAGQAVEALVRTAEGWYGYAPQPSGTAASLAQLVWLSVPDGDLRTVQLSVACGALPVVTYP